MGSSTCSSPALPLQGWRSILQGRPHPGAGDAELTVPTLWARRGDTAQPPEELPIGMPLALQGEKEMCLLFPCALHVSGQRTKPPKPPRAEIPRESPGARSQPRGSVSIMCLQRVGAW